MKEYKGLYNNNEDKKTDFFEHGAHFKYLDLVNALKELQTNSKNDEQTQETDNISKNKIEILMMKEKIKKRRKYKLKLYDDNNNNQRYKDIYSKEDAKFNKNIKDSFNNKRIKVIKNISKSVDRSQDNLPKIIYNNINNNNSISLRNKSFNPKKITETIINNNDEDIIPINKSVKNFEIEKDKEKFLPKISSYYYKQLTKENEDRNSDFFEEETKNQSKRDNKKYINNLKYNSIKNRRIFKLFLNEKNNNRNDIINTENSNSKSIINNKLKSIFDTEKQIKIKNNNIDKIDFNDKNYFEKINNDITHQIYQLKKNLSINTNKL